jgi:hypothetical protein
MPKEPSVDASIYQRALGADFDRLHPKIRQRFGFSSADGVACVGHGVMDSVWRGRAYTLPFLALGTWRNIMFPTKGEQVAFTIENYAYQDTFGRETVTWTRTFQLRTKVRRFDATMIYSRQRGHIVDYLGTHQHLAVDLHLSVDEGGGLRLTSGEQRFYEGRVGFRFPPALSGVAEVHEWYDDEAERYRIDVRVSNPRWGPLFGYSGSFEVDWIDSVVPTHVRPVREERRE